MGYSPDWMDRQCKLASSVTSTWPSWVREEAGLHPLESIPKYISTKSEMYDEFFKGSFGNKLKTWETLEEYLEDNHKGVVCIRYKEPGSKWLIYNITRDKVLAEIDRIVSEGGKRSLITLNERAPDELITFQGEVCRSPLGLHLKYSTEPITMRNALKNPLFADGLKALSLLKYYMDPSSFENLERLLDTYSNSKRNPTISHIVEFTCFSESVGSLNLNTLFWEVRDF